MSRSRESEIERLKCSIKETEDVTKEKLPSGDYPRVLLLGQTGSGKTTLLYSLLDSDLFCMKMDGVIVLRPLNDELYGKIGHTTDAQTRVPNIVRKGPVVICDCPGFSDTEDWRKIVNAYAIEQLLVPPCKIRILIVLQVDDTGAARSEKAKELFDSVCLMFPDKEELKSSTALIVTQIGRDEDRSSCLGKLRTGTWRNCLLDYFLDNEKGKKKVFEFPIVPKDMVGKKYDIFEDKTELVRFIENGATMENPKHKLVFDGEAKNLVKDLCISFKREIESTLKKLVTEVSKLHRDEKQLESIQKWKGMLQELRKSCNGLAEFCACAETQLTSFSALSRILADVKSFATKVMFVSSLEKGLSEEDVKEISLDLEEVVGLRLDAQLEELKRKEESLSSAKEKKSDKKSRDGEGILDVICSMNEERTRTQMEMFKMINENNRANTQLMLEVMRERNAQAERQQMAATASEAVKAIGGLITSQQGN